MGPQVPGDHVPAAGRVRALGTLVRLLAGVRPLVGAQMVRPAEYLAAYLARVRFYPRVQPHVSGEHVRPRETPLAHVAQVGLGGRVLGPLPAMPRRHVLGQTIVQAEHLPAHGANVRHVRPRRHLLHDGRYLEVVSDGDALLGGGRRHVPLDHGHAHRAPRHDAGREQLEGGRAARGGGGCGGGRGGRRGCRRGRRHQVLHREVERGLLGAGRVALQETGPQRVVDEHGRGGGERRLLLPSRHQVRVRVAPSPEYIRQVLGVHVVLETVRRERSWR